MQNATLERALIALLGFTARTASSRTRTSRRAVTLTTIASSTNEDFCAATRTEKTAGGIVHRWSSDDQRTHRQARAPVLRWGRTCTRYDVLGRGTRTNLQRMDRCRARSLRSFTTELPSPSPSLPAQHATDRKSRSPKNLRQKSFAVPSQPNTRAFEPPFTLR